MKLQTKENTIRLSHKRIGGRLNHVSNKSIRNRLSRRDKEKQNSSAESQATDKVEQTTDTLSYETRYQIKRFATKQKNKRRIAQLEKENNLNIRSEALRQYSSPSFNQRRLKYKNNQNYENKNINSSKLKNKQVEHLAKNTTIQKLHGIDTNKVSNTVKNMYKRTEDFIIATFAQIKSITISSNHLLIIGVSSICLVIIIMFSFYGIRGISVTDEPNFYNLDAYVIKNPYAQVELYGQCTWFAWGRFYELYGYDPGFRGDGWNCAEQLVETHPDKWELSEIPQAGAVFSCVERNHVGIVVEWDGVNITIQEGNLDGETNTFEEAKSDWRTVTYDIDTFIDVCKGVVFAININ